MFDEDSQWTCQSKCPFFLNCEMKVLWLTEIIPISQLLISSSNNISAIFVRDPKIVVKVVINFIAIFHRLYSAQCGSAHMFGYPVSNQSMSFLFSFCSFTSRTHLASLNEYSWSCTWDSVSGILGSSFVLKSGSSLTKSHEWWLDHILKRKVPLIPVLRTS